MMSSQNTMRVAFRGLVLLVVVSLVIECARAVFTPDTRVKLAAQLHQCKVAGWDLADPECDELEYWNTSLITDMSFLFAEEPLFNLDIGRWDVSQVTTMKTMFRNARAFNIDLSQWDVSRVANMETMFFNADNFEGDGLDQWDVSRVTNMNGMFKNTYAFRGDLSSWNVAKVTNMHEMLYWCRYFTADVSNWDVSSVTNMRRLFYTLSFGDFDPDLSRWNTSRVTTMEEMFESSTKFTGRGLSGWDVSNVENMRRMFYRTPLAADLSRWDTGKVTNMHGMFASSDFNSALDSWDVSAVEDMACMFCFTDFDQDLSKWDTSSVITMESMFDNAVEFNGNISAWNVTRVTSMADLFNKAERFNGDISSWDVSRVTDMGEMFEDAYDFNTDISRWDPRSCEDMFEMFRDTYEFNADISRWNVARVLSFEGMFRSARKFNADIGRWDVSRVTTMEYMFYFTRVFSQDLSQWDVSRVQNMYGMFRSSQFNGDVSGWDTQGVQDMGYLFYSCDEFTSDIRGWNVSRVTNMHSMFYSTQRFLWDLDQWDTSRVTSMHSMFERSHYSGNISQWDVSGVTTMGDMFRGTRYFNLDISRWNVGNVGSMFQMFLDAQAFNQNLTEWNTSKVTNMKSMFSGAIAFNGDLSTWDVSRVVDDDMDDIFRGAVSFNRELAQWDVQAEALNAFEDGCPKESFQDVDECLAGVHYCAPFATCSNTAGPPGSFICECDQDVCQNVYNCTEELPALRSIQVTSTPAFPDGKYFIWNDDLVQTHEHAVALLQFGLLPPVQSIGKATLRLSKARGFFPCRQQVLRAYHADFECCVEGAGVRRLQELDPPVERMLPVPHADEEAEELLIDVTEFVRGGCTDMTFVISDPNNCQSSFFSSLHANVSLRPALLVEWNGDECARDQRPADVAGDDLFPVSRGTVAEVEAECHRRGAVLANIESEEDAAAASVACSELPCWISTPSSGQPFQPWLPTHPIDGRDPGTLLTVREQGTAVWTSQGLWQSVNSSLRLAGLCRLCPAGSFLDSGACRSCPAGKASPLGSTSSSHCKTDLCVDSGAGPCSCPEGWTNVGGECVDEDECGLGTHDCLDSTATLLAMRAAESGLTHWYKLDPQAPLHDSRGSNALIQIPNTTVDHLYSRLDCLSADESCAHWSPQPSPQVEEWDDEIDVLRWQIPLQDFEPTTGVTVTFWYKRWTNNNFGPRVRNLLSLRNQTAADGEGADSECGWALEFTSALNQRLATQVLRLHPSGFFSLDEVNVLETERWYHIALVMTDTSRARLYIDYEKVGPDLFFDWDPACYQSPHVLELDVIRMEARADIKVFNQALDAADLRSRFAYRSNPSSITSCSNTEGSFVCDCDVGFRGTEGGSCEAADACELGTHSCKAPALCRPSPDGWYTCECPEGNSPDSHFSCTFDDVCATGQDTCHGFAVCTPTDTSFECECLPGWEGDGVNCRAWDTSVQVEEIRASADGWVEPFLPLEAVERESSNFDRSFATPYLAIGAGWSHFGGTPKYLRTILQFDHLPAGLFLAQLELTHIYRSDPDYCGRFLGLTLTAVDAEIFDAIDYDEAVRRLEQQQDAVTKTILAPNHGWVTGRILLDVSEFVREAAPNGGHLAFTISRRAPFSGVCDDWFAPTDDDSNRGPRLHVAFRQQRDPAIETTMALEASFDATVDLTDLDNFNISDGGEASLTVSGAQGTEVAVFRFEGLPTDVSEAHLMLTQFADAGSSCEDAFYLESVDVEVTNGSISMISRREGEARFPLQILPVRRQLALNVTDLVRGRASNGTLSFVLRARTDDCSASFRSAQYIPEGEYGLVNVRSSQRPWLDIRYPQECGGCHMWVSQTSTLMRHGNCSCATLGLANLAIRAIDVAALHGLSMLTALDMSGNGLTSIPSNGMFRDLVNLRLLDLSHNRIASISPGVFSSMSSLEQLWLHQNSLTVLQGSAFSGLVSLQTLSVSRNQVAFVELGAFKNLTQLVWLDLSHNKIASIDFYVWEDLASLQALSLGDNYQLECIPMIPDAVKALDLSFSGGGFNFFNVQPICLPYGCPIENGNFEFDLRSLLSGDGKAFFFGLGSILSTMRQDASADLDLVHRQHHLHVARSDVTRCICSGAPWCIDVASPLAGDGETCAADSECQSNACCDGACAPLLELDHRGPVCPHEPPTGFLSVDKGRTVLDVDECSRQIDDCHRDAICVNSEGSFQCHCMEGYRSVGAVEGVECEDVDECVERPGVCEDIEEAYACENTVGSFGCTAVINDFGVVVIEAVFEFPAPGTVKGGPSWAAVEYRPKLRHLEVPRLLKLFGDTWAEREGAAIIALIARIAQGRGVDVAASFLGDALRRSDGAESNSEPARALAAGSAIKLLPDELELLDFAEVTLPIDPDQDFADREFRVWLWDARINEWEQLTTLGLTPDGRAVSALTKRFGLHLAVAVCPGGTLAGADAVACSACPAGSFAEEGATACSECPLGAFSPEASPACVPCPAGTFSGQLGASTCEACEAGKYSNASQSMCVECSEAGAPGQWGCPCPAGWERDGFDCVDVDECEAGMALCGFGGLCSNTVGGYACECFDGWMLARGGEACEDVDECERDNGGCAQTCHNQAGSFHCSCGSGWTLSRDGLQCDDVNECTDGSADCDDQAECQNQAGGFACRCPGGWQTFDDGRTCVASDIVECSNCTCSESETGVCHADAFCRGTESVVGFPTGSDIVPPGVSKPSDSSGMFACSCPGEMLGHGYGAGGCDAKGYAVRILYRNTTALTPHDEDNLMLLLGNLSCKLGSLVQCDHIHYTQHGKDLGVNILFRFSDEGLASAEDAAATFNAVIAQIGRRSGQVPPQVDTSLGARVFAWDVSDSSSSFVSVLPTGMDLQSVHFEPTCSTSGCWVLNIVYTTGSNDQNLQTYNTFFLPYAVGNDALSFDYSYADHGILDTFQPAHFPCRVSDYVAADGTVVSLPARSTACCFGTSFNTSVADLGGDGSGRGVLGRYRVTAAFEAYAAAVYPDLCPGGIDAPAIDDRSGSATTPKPEDRLPDGEKAGLFHADDFLAVGQQFVGMPLSPGVTASQARDALLGQYEATIKLDETELRNKAGLLRGTVGVEHTVDFFLGFANFKPASSTWILDTLATQVAVHVEKTSFFSVATHGVNDYTFLEYVNVRLVAVLNEDSDFSGQDESADRSVRTNSSAAEYVQVTFTLRSKYGVNANDGLIPLASVRAGRGTFLDRVEAVGGMHHKCMEYTSAPANEFATAKVVSAFNHTIHQSCAPAAAMCDSPATIPDSFVAFNIPLGIDFLGAGSSLLDSVVFVDLVISAVDKEARTSGTSPNSGEAPWQMKTTLTASIPVVDGGLNIFCDGVTAKTDLKDVADVDIVVGTAASVEELSRLRIMEDVASTQLDAQGEVVVDSDSIEAGLLTLVIKGNASYFASGSLNTRQVSLELEDVITIHLMEADGQTADGAGSQGKQQAVKDLLAEPPADNSDADGLNTDGYTLNGAFSFTIDRSAQRAHLEPSTRLLQHCPLNPPRPAATGNLVMETCVTRRDVRYRDFPWRAGAVSTAMEVAPSAAEAALGPSSAESRFLSGILGNSDYARQLASAFASAIDSRYELDGRFRRAFWINPGYEWAPAHTGGHSLFQLSQKVFLFALVTIDEQISTDAGPSIAGTPRLPPARRALLSVVDAQADTALSAAELSFPVTSTSLFTAAFDAPAERMARLQVGMQLSDAEACLSSEELQGSLRGTLEEYLSRTGSGVETVQLLSLTVDRGDAECGGNAARRSLQQWSSAAVDMEVLVVFAADAAPSIDLDALSQQPRVRSVATISVPRSVAVRPISSGTASRMPQTEDPETSGGIDMVIVAAGASVGVLAACAIGFCLVRRRGQEAAAASADSEEAEVQRQLKAELAFDHDSRTSSWTETDKRLADVCV